MESRRAMKTWQRIKRYNRKLLQRAGHYSINCYLPTQSCAKTITTTPILQMLRSVTAACNMAMPHLQTNCAPHAES